MKKSFNTKRIGMLLMGGVLLGSNMLTGCSEGRTGSLGERIERTFTRQEISTQSLDPEEKPESETKPFKSSKGVTILATAEHKDVMDRLEGAENNSAAIEKFSKNLLPYMMKEGEDTVVSPINIYVAFAMLAEVTDGDTRQEILDALGCENIGELREIAKALIKANDYDNGALTSLMANSMWLRDDEKFTYNQETLNKIADEYLAESCSGEMGSEDVNLALQNWLNENTGNLLKEQASNITTSPDSILTLASTIYYKGSWCDDFYVAGEDTFYGFAGEQECTMIRRTEDTYVYTGKDFTAVNIDIRAGGSMWVLMPKKGVNPEELLENDKAAKFIYENNRDNAKCASVRLTMPKFDVDSDLDLIGAMKNMGVIKAFDGDASDFSNLVEDEDVKIAVTSAKHAARVVADENGVLAAAYTVIDICETAACMPEDPIEVTIDRPFLFAIQGDDDSLLFIGTVYEPGNK